MDKMRYEQNWKRALPKRKHSLVVKEQRSRALGFIPSSATNFSYNLEHITKTCASSVPPETALFLNTENSFFRGQMTVIDQWKIEHHDPWTSVWYSSAEVQNNIVFSLQETEFAQRYNSSYDIAQSWEDLTGAFRLFKIQFKKEIQFPPVLLSF